MALVLLVNKECFRGRVGIRGGGKDPGRPPAKLLRSHAPSGEKEFFPRPGQGQAAGFRGRLTGSLMGYQKADGEWHCKIQRLHSSAHAIDSWIDSALPSCSDRLGAQGSQVMQACITV